MPRVDTRKACLNCRTRHLKCDEELPSCRRCRQSNLLCKHRVTHTFRRVSFGQERQSTNKGSSGSPVSIPEDAHSEELGDENRAAVARFVDETSSVVEAHGKQSLSAVEHREETYPSLSGISPQPSNMSPSASYFFDNPPSIIGLPLAASIHHVSSGINRGTYDPETSETPIPSIPIAQLSKPSQVSPSISHPREAYLLKFFTQTWGPIFDCLDADLTFTKSVLHIALTSYQPLFWAILATSALQLSRVSDYPFSAAKYYRSQCSKSIMPLLLQSASPGDNEETLFATYVMLRNYDHMTENLMEKNPDTLFTAALAISANPSNTMSDQMDLGRAAFWVHLRQDIHVALLLHIPINTDYPPCLHREKVLENLDIIISERASIRQETLDCAWANRVAILLADIINYCFQQGPRTLEDWIRLRSRLDHWSIAKPRKFQPYYERAPNPSEGRVFPDIWISSDCCVLAWLYYHSATILLKTYPPNYESYGNPSSDIPALGGLERREEVLIHARAICGIAFTNPNAQALIVICHIATISAIFFTSEAEQNETIKLLRMAHTITGHPLRDVEQKLRNSWAHIGPEIQETVSWRNRGEEIT